MTIEPSVVYYHKSNSWIAYKEHQDIILLQKGTRRVENGAESLYL